MSDLEALLTEQSFVEHVSRWLDGAEARRVEPRISEEAIGAVSIEPVPAS